jgi:undecaprenyl-diphosphatase
MSDGWRSGAAPVAGLVIGVADVTVTGIAARSRTLHPVELRTFRSVNDLSGGLLPPVFIVMQAGSLGAVFASGAIAYLAGRRRLAATMTVAGVSVWAACKVVKRGVGRGRPSAHLERVVVRGPAERGLGFPSGHSAVAVTLAGVAAADAPGWLRPVLWGVAGTVAAARLYVGAHLPLDVVGGAGIGLVAVSVVRLLPSP